jgi:hypothetical protein
MAYVRNGLKGALIVSAIVLATTAAMTEALADEFRLKRARFEQSAGEIRLTVGFRELFDAALLRQLRSGFATTVVMRLEIRSLPQGDLVAVAIRSVRAVYDLWQEKFIVVAESPQQSFTAKFERVGDVVDRLTSFWRFPLLQASKLRLKQRYLVRGLVEVNPMNPELLKEVRRWLRNPQRRQRSGTGESFFGSFVSVFVNDRVSRAERTFKFRTQPFERGRR